MNDVRKRLFIVVSMALFIFSIYLGMIIQSKDTNKITGLVTSEHGEVPVLSEVPPQELSVGEEFTYPLEIYDPDSSKFYFQDNTPLFSVGENGLIRFTPQPNDIGRHTAVIIVEDESGNFNSILISFNIS